MLSFFYIYSSHRRHSSEKEHKIRGDREKVLWANLTVNPLVEERKFWREGGGAIKHFGKRMGSGDILGKSLRDIGGRDVEGYKDFIIDLGLKT